MKFIAVALIGLLIGAGTGWYFGYTRANAQAAKEVHKALDADEGGSAMAAMIAAESVRYIDSGDIQKAVQSLSFPIASYYCVYGIRAGTNAERLKVKGYIDQFASTNQIVAAQIKKEMSR